MKIILEDYSCYVDFGDAEVEVHGEMQSWPRPRLPVIEGRIAFRDDPGVQVEVKALLDTGNDVTIVKPEKVRELEKRLDIMFPVERRFSYYGSEQLEPAYDLAFMFPGDHVYSSDYGFIAPASWDFDLADMWLGQELFSQLVITFNGGEATVTIIDLEVKRHDA